MKKIYKFLLVVFTLFILSIIIILSINWYVLNSSKKYIVGTDKKKNIDNVDSIIIFGASIQNNKPSLMLEDRLKMGIILYNLGVSDKILVTGDHINDDYDEVSVMKKYLVDNGIPSDKIFVDHNGISSYDSIYRARKIYKNNKVILVTQKYHLYRALYIANHLDLDAYGVAAEDILYQGQEKRDLREIFARVKDFIKCIYKPEASYLGEVFPIKGNGDNTNLK